jgi:hypothetical protein
MLGNVAHIGESERVYGVLVGKPKGKKPLGGTRLRRKNNIQMDLQEIVCAA